MPAAPRLCYICKTSQNPIIAQEPVEHRFGRPLTTEGGYSFARCRGCSTLYVDSAVTDEYLSEIYAEERGDTITEAYCGHEELLCLRLPEFSRHWAQIKKLRPPSPGELLNVRAQTCDFRTLGQEDAVQPNGIELSRSYADSCRRGWEGES